MSLEPMWIPRSDRFPRHRRSVVGAVTLVLLCASPARAASTCEVPASAEQAKAWAVGGERAGWPREVADVGAALDALSASEGCPAFTLETKDYLYWYGTWSGTCMTSTGYEVQIEGSTEISLAADRWETSVGTVDWTSLTLVATEAADGSLPTGTLAIRRSWPGEPAGSPSGLVAEWTLTDAGPTVLPLSGGVLSASYSSSSGCLDTDAYLWTTEDGCTVEASAQTGAVTTDAYARETLTGDTWTLTVDRLQCGSTTANLDGVVSVVDPDTWALRAVTDADGDGCAVEDCDCDDTSPSVYGGARDTDGDGVDADCDGTDAAGLSSDCSDPVTSCVLGWSPDAGGGETGGGDTAAADTAGDTGAGDTSAPDSGTTDTSATDTAAGDTSAPDTGTTDTSSPDTGTTDTSAPDTGTAAPDTSPAETSPSDPGPSAACGCVSAPGVPLAPVALVLSVLLCRRRSPGISPGRLGATHP